MCTLSIIARAQGYRVVMNRDEQRSRAAGEPPAWRELADVRALCPLDPQGGGTWIATSEPGLTLALTNVNPRPYPALPPGPVSRGTIIPMAIGCAGLREVAGIVAGLALDRFAPFRLVGVMMEGAAVRVASWRWDRAQLQVETDIVPPACFVSSGLGDERVEPRLSLFRTALESVSDASQDAFHRHAWPGREDVSVLMSRDDARTVSITTVEVQASAGAPTVAMRYDAVAEAGPTRSYHRA